MGYIGSFVNIFLVSFFTIVLLNKILYKQVKFSSIFFAKYFLGIILALYLCVLFYVVTGINMQIYSFTGTMLLFGCMSLVTVFLDKLVTKSKLTAKLTETKPNGKKITKPWVGYIIWSILYIVCIICIEVIRWSKKEFNVGLTEVIFTVTSPLQGSDNSVVNDAIEACLVPVLCAVIPIIVITIIDIAKSKEIRVDIQLRKRRLSFNGYSMLRKLSAGLCICIMAATILYANREYEIFDYVSAKFQQTTIYEDYYVDPSNVEIKAKEEPKNLIFIYLESMETTYANRENGGRQTTNRMPNLTQMAKDNISFSHSNGLGGYRAYEGTAWTLGALFATNAGVPFAFPVNDNEMDKYAEFASGITTLGDILYEKGYNQEFLCGSDADFAGRRAFFEQHGNYKIYDLYTAREDGYIPEDYFVWWGYEDYILYDIAKDELVKLAAKDEPFNFTMLTVDTHFPQGYQCSLCTDENSIVAENVIECADRQINEFILWCQQQEFYEDTVIVIVGDHPRMDTVLVGNVEYMDRTMYNCIINADVDKSLLKLTNREWSSMDVMPTVLAAMGYEIEGDRLGLGTNMFSGLETLSEQMGYENLNTELFKVSDYYVEKFR